MGAQGFYRCSPALILLALPLILAGCGPGKPAAAINVKRSDDPDAKLFDYPEFLNWNRFPIGTTVVLESVITGPQGDTTETYASELVQKTDKELTLKKQVTFVGAGPEEQNPPLEVILRAKVLSKASAEKLDYPRSDAERLGTETIEVLGEPREAVVWQWVDKVEAGPMKVKLWRCDEIPGRLVRQESEVTDQFGKDVKTVMRVTSIEIPAT